jgi:hypothetical protein
MDFEEDNKNMFENLKVTISVEKINSKKFITNVIGIAEDLDLQKKFVLFKKN